MNIGDQIKFNRGVKNLTQARLSELLDISRDILISYEKGRTLPPVKTLIKLSEVLEFNFLSRDEAKMINQESFYLDTMSLSDLRNKYLYSLVHVVSYNTYRRYKCVIDEFISIIGNIQYLMDTIILENT